MSQPEMSVPTITSGPAAAAFLAAGLGAFTMGLLAVLSALGVFAPPNLYPPVGGLTGKIAMALAVWLIAWAGLHFRWRKQQVALDKVLIATLALTALGILSTSVPYLLR
jgi:hypothetical protein